MEKRINSSGFSLIEVNMAVFVMAIGIVGLLSLFPAGLRESMQSRADLKQVMFSEYVLALVSAKAADPAFSGNFANVCASPVDVQVTSVEYNADVMPAVKEYALGGGDVGKSQMRYRLRQFDSDIAGVTLPTGTYTTKSLILVQSSEQKLGFFRSNPVFLTALNSWRQN